MADTKPRNLTTIAVPHADRSLITLLALVLLKEQKLERIPFAKDTIVMAVKECLVRRGYTEEIMQSPAAEIRKILTENPLAQ